jgi:transcriptional regulator with XRE-family HTH domain
VGLIQHNLLMDDLIIIGINITRIRKEKGMTQEDLCGVTELDRSHLSEIENGKMNVTIKSLSKIADALDVTLSILLER